MADVSQKSELFRSKVNMINATKSINFRSLCVSAQMLQLFDARIEADETWQQGRHSCFAARQSESFV